MVTARYQLKSRRFRDRESDLYLFVWIRSYRSLLPFPVLYLLVLPFPRTISPPLDSTHGRRAISLAPQGFSKLTYLALYFYALPSFILERSGLSPLLRVRMRDCLLINTPRDWLLAPAIGSSLKFAYCSRYLLLLHSPRLANAIAPLRGVQSGMWPVYSSRHLVDRSFSFLSTRPHRGSASSCDATANDERELLG